MYFCCRTVVLVFFFSCFRTTNCKVAVLPRIHIFDNVSFKSKLLQMKLIPKLHSNILGILTSKRRGQKLLINAERKIYNGIFGFEQYQLARFHSGV